MLLSVSTTRHANMCSLDDNRPERKAFPTLSSLPRQLQGLVMRERRYLFRQAQPKIRISAKKREKSRSSQGFIGVKKSSPKACV